ncbi:5'-deoxynucleotidase HDDC2-like, partial [Panonychus citri]
LSSSPLTSPGAGSSHQELLSSSLPSPSPVLDETIDSTILESSINRRHIRDETRIDSNLNQALYNRQQINQSKTENIGKIKFLMEVGKLKQIERTGWILNKIHSPERIAGHMYRMAIIPLLVLSTSNTTKVDLNKVIKLSLVHDIAECIVGDFTPYDDISPEEKHRLEENAVQYLSSLLPSTVTDNFLSLYSEYEEQLTAEAQLTKELDRFDLVLQAFEYEKIEYKRTGILPGLGEFFDFERILSYIRNQELKEMIGQILHMRSEFLANACVQTCNQDGSPPKANPSGSTSTSSSPLSSSSSSSKKEPKKPINSKEKRKTTKKSENSDL